MEEIKLNAYNKALMTFCETLIEDLESKFEATDSEEESDKLLNIKNGVRLVYDYINRV